MFGKLDNKKLFTFVVVAVLLYCVFNMGKPVKSDMMGLQFPGVGKKASPEQGISGTDMDEIDDQYAPANLAGTNTDLNIDVDLTGITIPAGDSFVIQGSPNGGETVFEDTYGFAADLYTSAFLSNGDDRYILATADDGAGVGTTIVDIAGVIDQDGTGEPWEFTDGYLFRNPSVNTGNGGVFDLSEWTVGGVNSLETGDDAEEAILIVASTTPGAHSFIPIPEPSTAVLGGVALLGLLRRRR